MKPLVSILMPTRNRPLFFKKALDSALAQTYDNIEIIICDNSDNDETKQVVETYLSTYPFIHYEKNETDLKYIGNMSECLSLANGEFVNYLFDDDLFDPTKIEVMMNYLLLDEDIHLVSSPFYFINETDEVLGTNESIFRRGINWMGSGQVMIDQMVGKICNFVGVPTTVLFRKSAMKQPFGKYHEFEFIFASDMALWLDLLSTGKCVYLDDPLSYYRFHQGQTTAEDKKSWGKVMPGFIEGVQLVVIVGREKLAQSKEHYVLMLANLLKHYEEKLLQLTNQHHNDVEIPNELGKLIHEAFDCIKNYENEG